MRRESDDGDASGNGADQVADDAAADGSCGTEALSASMQSAVVARTAIGWSVNESAVGNSDARSLALELAVALALAESPSVASDPSIIARSVIAVLERSRSAAESGGGDDDGDDFSASSGMENAAFCTLACACACDGASA